MPMKIGIYCMVRVVCLDQREYMFENFEENHVLLRPGAKVTQFYADGVDYALADGTTGSLRGYDNIVLAMGSRSNTALKEIAESEKK